MARATPRPAQRGFFDELPPGLEFREEFITPEEEGELLRHAQELTFAPFQFHGFEGKRRVVSFGWRYDFNGGGLQETDAFPPFLLSLRDAAAASFGLEARSLEQALLIEYSPGASIGWHSDRPVFGDVLGISLLSSCTFRFRRKAGAKWERQSITAELGATPRVSDVVSYWSLANAPPLRADDSSSALVLARIDGTEDEIRDTVDDIRERAARLAPLGFRAADPTSFGAPVALDRPAAVIA